MLTNAFSLNMLPEGFAGKIVIGPTTTARARGALVTGGSAVGHPDTAALFSAVLGVHVPVGRRTVTLQDGDAIVVGQYRGPRLEAGATKLPDGAKIEWMLVVVVGS